MSTKSNALVYFEELKAKGDGLWDYLFFLGKSEILEEKQENEWREFKGFPGERSPNVRKYWAEALSGFANTEGGVLIWGLDCRKGEGEHPVDEVKENPQVVVSAPRSFAQMLKDFILGSVDPVVQGVLVDCVEREGQGFVVCFIPEGNVKPYRSEVEKNYFIRAGDSFVKPSVSLLRSLFFSKTTALLTPCLAFGKKSTAGVFIMQVKNVGLATAKDVWVEIEVSAFVRHSASFESNLTTMFSGRRANGPIKDLHPGQWLDVAGFEVDEDRVADGLSMYVKVNFYCSDAPPQKWLYSFPFEDREREGFFYFSQVS